VDPARTGVQGKTPGTKKEAWAEEFRGELEEVGGCTKFSKKGQHSSSPTGPHGPKGGQRLQVAQNVTNFQENYKCKQTKITSNGGRGAPRVLVHFIALN